MRNLTDSYMVQVPGKFYKDNQRPMYKFSQKSSVIILLASGLCDSARGTPGPSRGRRLGWYGEIFDLLTLTKSCDCGKHL